jgi:hypothetical protein
LFACGSPLFKGEHSQIQSRVVFAMNQSFDEGIKKDAYNN